MEETLTIEVLPSVLPLSFGQAGGMVEPGAFVRIVGETGASPGSSYQWYRNGSPLLADGRVRGTDTSALEVDAFSVADNGYYHSRIWHDDGGVTEIDPVWYGVAESFASWLDRNGMTGFSPEADPDGDGFPLLADYTFGRAPNQSETLYGGPVFGEDGILYVCWPSTATAVEIDVEVSRDLCDWLEIGPQDRWLASTDGGLFVEAFDLPYALRDSDRASYRVRLTLSP